MRGWTNHHDDTKDFLSNALDFCVGEIHRCNMLQEVHVPSPTGPDNVIR